jgi:hypothetical protein
MGKAYLSVNMFKNFPPLSSYIHINSLILYTYMCTYTYDCPGGPRSKAYVLAAWLLGSWVRIPLEVWIFLFVILCYIVLCRYSPLRRADHLYKGVLSNIFTRLRSLRCETAKVLTSNVEPLMIKIYTHTHTHIPTQSKLAPVVLSFANPELW